MDKDKRNNVMDGLLSATVPHIKDLDNHEAMKRLFCLMMGRVKEPEDIIYLAEMIAKTAAVIPNLKEIIETAFEVMEDLKNNESKH